MVEYINKKVYKDTKSYKVLKKDEYNGVATVIEVEKIPSNLIWENRKCININEAFENAPISEVKDAKPFEVYKNKNGVWGVYKKVSHSIPRKVFEVTNMKNTSEYEYSEDGEMVYVFETNKNGKIKTVFEKFGDIETTCRYFYDYNS